MVASLCIESGIVLIVGWIVLISFAFYVSHYMLTSRASKYKLKSYSELSEFVGGKPLRVLLILGILGFLFAACMSCQIISIFEFTI